MLTKARKQRPLLPDYTRETGKIPGEYTQIRISGHDLATKAQAPARGDGSHGALGAVLPLGTVACVQHQGCHLPCVGGVVTTRGAHTPLPEL